jgi:putative transposase
MSEPRYVVPGQTLFITRNVHHRVFRLRPGRETNQIIQYSLAYAAKKTGVEVHAISVMSNHLHLFASDPLGRFPEFLREFHRMAAKALNAAHGEEENLWAAEPTNVQVVVDGEAMVDRIAYIVANPVAEGLVKSPEQWPGFLAWNPVVIPVKRPEVYFDPAGVCPEEIELRIVRPSGPGWTEAVWRELLGKAIAARVGQAWDKMARARRKFAGPAAVLAESVRTQARSWRERRGPIPRIAAMGRESWRVADLVRRTFLAAYRDALKRWCGGDREVVFPRGTWWMVRHHGAAVEPEPAGV